MGAVFAFRTTDSGVHRTVAALRMLARTSRIARGFQLLKGTPMERRKVGRMAIEVGGYLHLQAVL